MEHSNHEKGLTNRHAVSRKLDAISWGLFFIWIGAALIAHVGWGLGLLGVGIITLGTQVARKYFGLKLEGFWVVAGLFFVLGGVWELLHVRLGLLPILSIAVGVALLVSTLVGKPGDSALCRLRRGNSL
jgi:predicted phage tail protein